MFDKTHIGSMALKNRFIRSAVYDGVSDATGHVTPQLCTVYSNLAKGGVGTMITGLCAVTDVEQLLPGQMGIYDDSFIDDYKPLVHGVHEHHANIILQIAALGPQTITDSDASKVMWGPSPIMDGAFHNTPHAMPNDMILFFQQAFADAARRAQAAGFDGVQIHAAHGYLLGRFLSPHYNRRSDEYGDSIENRSRMLRETYAAVRAAVGPQYPVFVKINCDDFMDGGMPFEECMYVCQELDREGIDAIEISGGSRSSRDNEGYARKIDANGEAYFAQYAKRIKSNVKAPVISVGGHRNLQTMTSMLNDDSMDYLALARPFICENDLVARWKAGDTAPAQCISCNTCAKPGPKVCIFHKKAAEDAS